MEQKGMQPNDILINRGVGASVQNEGTREFFTLYRWRSPATEKIGGPWDTEQVAREKAIAMAKEDDGCHVWLEDGPDTHNYTLIS